MKRGRKSKPYRASNGQTVDGLYRKPDGRWRISATGYEFRESDETQALAKFHQLTGGDDRIASERIQDHSEAEMKKWCKWFAEQIYTRPQWLAEQCGVEQLGYLLTIRKPQTISLADLRTAFDKFADGEQSKKHVLRAFDEMMELTAAKTLADLDKPTLVTYADAIKKQTHSAGYIGDKFGRIKRVIKFGMKREFDEKEIVEFLNRAAVLIAPKAPVAFDPHPITATDFHKLLKTADTFMKAALLLSLNAALYCKELLEVEWGDLDLEAGTFLTIRRKRGVPRAATLWPQTIEALKKLQQIGGVVFKSSHGTAYHPNSFRKMFAKLRTSAGVSAEVEWNNLRDGAYTAVCNAGVSSDTGKFLMGHRMRGEADNYALRSPQAVKPACEAVYKKYFAKELQIAAA